MVSAFGFGTSQRGNVKISDLKISFSHSTLASPVNEKSAKLVPGPGQYVPPEPGKVRRRAPKWG